MAKILGKFDLQSECVTERFQGEIDLEWDWTIGCIVGASGTGKSTIAKELFPEQYVSPMKETMLDERAIVDAVAPSKSVDEVVQMFNSVGFSSPPSWLKPFQVLSSGEQMRVLLAEAMLSDKDMIVFDEFTSVVDRVVARIGSKAIAKAVRRAHRRFVAVCCHYDILDWLEPDWVFCTDDMSFKKKSQLRLDSKSTSVMVQRSCGDSLGSIII